MSAGRSLATPVAALLLLSILVLGAWMRLDGLADPPLWWDEGINAYFARSSPARLLAMARASHDTDPPAHRLALKPWLAVAGRSAWSLRLLSVVCGLLTIVVTYAWGSWLWGRPTGLLAASLLALMPMAIYYSREAKAYPFVALFGSLGSYLWARYLVPRRLVAPDAPAYRGRQRVLLWATFVLTCALAVGAHYYAALLMAAQGAWLLAWRTARGPECPAPSVLGHWLLAQGAAAALVLPWPLLTFRSAVSGALGLEKGPPAWHLLGYLREVGSSLAAGPYGGGWAAWVALAVLSLAGLWCLARDRRPRVALLACLVAVPLALAFALQGWVHFFAPRFLLYVTPPLCLLAAHGLTRLRWVGAALAVVLAVAWFTLLPEACGPLVAPEEDLRPLARTLAEMAEPSDAVVVGYPWQEGALSLYAPDLAAPYYLGWYTRENVADELAALWRQHPRIWLLSYRVPER
ncbi:MAG: glycosyltransferase family 39 protein, partial [Chloroflexota bacterium]